MQKLIRDEEREEALTEYGVSLSELNEMRQQFKIKNEALTARFYSLEEDFEESDFAPEDSASSVDLT